MKLMNELKPHPILLININLYTMSRWNLVNTSKPAKEAPTLVPGTLASFTSNSPSNPSNNLQRYHMKSYIPLGKIEQSDKPQITTNKPQVTMNKPNVAVDSEDEFPTLGKPNVPRPPSAHGSRPTFAVMSQQWATKKKEEEEKEKAEAEAEANKRRIKEEYEELERRSYTRLSKSFSSAKKQNQSNVRYLDIGCDAHEDLLSEDRPYEEDPQVYEEDESSEEVEEDADSLWNQRRRRGDL